MKANFTHKLCMADFLEDHKSSTFTEELMEIIHRNATKKRNAIKRLYGNIGLKINAIAATDLYRLRKHFTNCMNDSGWQLIPQLSGSEAEGFWSVAYKNDDNIIIVCSMSANSVENDKVPVVILSDLLQSPETAIKEAEFSQAC